MNPTFMTIFGIAFIFLMTTLGAALVFPFRKISTQSALNTLFLGFAGGVMIASAIWGLIIPAINQSSTMGHWAFVPALVGIVAGGLFLVLLDKLVPHVHEATNEEEGLKNHLKKSTKLFLAMTIHNVPEGLAVGVAFGAAAASGEASAYTAALMLAIGIGVQNFPEGAAAALPMEKEAGIGKAFLYGTASGIVEPIAAIIGYYCTWLVNGIQPWFLGFAAGAMIFVVIEDLIPESHLESHPHLGTWGFMSGFLVMMVLEVALA